MADSSILAGLGGVGGGAGESLNLMLVFGVNGSAATLSGTNTGEATLPGNPSYLDISTLSVMYSSTRNTAYGYAHTDFKYDRSTDSSHYFSIISNSDWDVDLTQELTPPYTYDNNYTVALLSIGGFVYGNLYYDPSDTSFKVFIRPGLQPGSSSRRNLARVDQFVFQMHLRMV